MASYVATAIHFSMPDARISWAVESRCMAMLDQERLLDHVVDFPRDQWRRKRWSPGVWRDQLSRFAELRRERYDFGLDLQGHSKTAICLRIARPAHRISAFATDTLAKKLNPLLPGDPDAKHRVERMLDAAQVFGDFTMPERPVMPKTLPKVDLGIAEDRPIATISTGAGAFMKQYPAPQWAQVAKGLISRGFTVVFLGAAPDPRVQVPDAVDRVAQWNLAETLSAVANSSIHLAADTGTGHMAAALGVPFVSVFGPTDPKLYRPYSAKGIVLRCSERPGDVPPAQILAAVEDLLG